MARIIKIRAIPRGFVKVEEKTLDDRIGEIMFGYTTADVFMALYMAFGKPQEGGMWSYMLRHNNVVFKMTAIDKDVIKYDVWLSPGHIQDAKRKRTKVVNIIARRLNEDDIAFVIKEDMDALYYSVRVKNSALMSKKMFTQEDTDNALTGEERTALYGGLTQFVPEVFDEIRSMMREVMVSDAAV